MNTPRHALAAAAVLGFSGLAVGPALAQPIELTVDPAQSTLDLTVDAVTALGSGTDSDSSPIAGGLTIELTPTTGLTTIHLIDYDFAAQNTLMFNLDFGFLGSINADGAGLGIQQPAGAPPTSGTVDAADMFTITGVPSEGLGTIDVTGSGVVGGLVGDLMITLADLGEASVDTTGTVSVVGDVVTLSGTVPVAFSQEVQPGVDVTVTGTATIVASGTIETVCTADTNGDGLLTPADFNGWIIAFNAQAPACDQNGDGACTPADFNAWIINFNAGC